mmetsp:Transcript_11729/g.41955  ORF Transcript_11729/g.41955 Transcript_11729/m.41955 type:complete len:491 (-) Transcript_11729:259-1731(-)
MAVKYKFRKLGAEFIGTFTLVFTACNDNMAKSQMASLSVAASLMVMIYALGSVSGGHFNPAVSLRLAECSGHGDFPIGQAVVYAATQLCAGLAAGFSSALLWSSIVGGPSSTLASNTTAGLVQAGNSSHPAVALGSPGNAYGAGSIIGCELIYTALLVFVVLNVATCGDEGKKERNYYFGLSIGFVIVAGASAIGSVSGCSLNPAVSFGVAASGAAFARKAPTSWMAFNFLLYAGSAAAVVLFMCCRRHLFDDEPRPSMASKLMSEFLGTFVLVLTVCLVVVQASASPLDGVVGIAASLMVMIYSLGAVSGANFNPAVSVGLLLIGELPCLDCVTYVLSQLLGGMVAVGSAAAITGDRWRVVLVSDADPRLGKVVQAGKGSWGSLVGSELFCTFVLVFVVLNVAVRDAPNQYYGLAIGFVILAGGVAVGGLSGGCFNPAVSFALDFGGIFAVSGPNKFGTSLVYAVAELAGAALAAGMFEEKLTARATHR